MTKKLNDKDKIITKMSIVDNKMSFKQRFDDDDDLLKYSEEQSNNKNSENVNLKNEYRLSRRCIDQKESTSSNLNISNEKRGNSVNKNKSKSRKSSVSSDLNNSNWELISSQIKNINLSLIQKAKNEKNKESQYEIHESFLYDNSILRQLEIEFVIEDVKNEENVNQIKEKIVEELKFYFSQNFFGYYEYSNPKKENKTQNNIERSGYNEFLKEMFNENFNKTSSKEINYISAMSSVYKKFCRSEVLNREYENYNNDFYDVFFYLATPLVSIYFFGYEKTHFTEQYISAIDNSGALISNYNKMLKKNLNEYGVNYKILELTKLQQKILEKIKKQNAPSIPLFSLPSAASEVQIFSSFINGYDESQYENFDSLIYIKNYNHSLFFNMVINEFEDTNLNIFSPYAFDFSTFHHLKFYIDSYVKNQNDIVINIKLYGMVFHSYLQLIIDYLTKADFLDGQIKLNTFKKTKNIKHNSNSEKLFNHRFSMNFHHYHKSSNYFSINKKLAGPVEKMEWKNGKFYIKTKII